MKISIIIPAFNEEKLLAATLSEINRSRQAFHNRKWSTELIVCDNNSTDRTAEIAKAAGAEVVFEPVNQIGRARNRGAELATGDWLLFVDADSHPAPELFEAVADAIESGRCVAGGSTIQLGASTLAARISAKVWNFISRTTRSLAGSFIFCETKSFREVGGFDQALYASEELDLTKKLKELAARDRRNIVILHDHPLLTSDRKFHLYSPGEYIRFLARTAFGFGQTLRNAKDCHLWYDGRR